MKTDTLSFRLFLFTSLWMVVSLAIVALLVSQDYRRTVEKQFEELITANLYNLMGAIKLSDDSKLLGVPQLGDSRYQQYRSGWYWTVNSLTDKSTSLASSSLAGLTLPALAHARFDANFQRVYHIVDEVGNSILAVEAQVFLGEGDDQYTFRVTGNLAVLDEEIANFRQQLILLLSVFGIGLIITSFVIVRFGLRPIRLATRQLAQIRDGKADRIDGHFPREIAPLIAETNALIKSNQAIIERSRTQVGNLAHSLKTPLSVLTMEADNLPAAAAKKLRTQLSAMNSQVQSYLNRAMISARHGAITSRTDVVATLDRLTRTFNKLFSSVKFTSSHDAGEQLVFAGEQQDLEEIIGNLLENSGKSGANNVTIVSRMIGSKSAPVVEIEICDDGPGLSEDEITYALKRGNRLDENQPGSGLGLSIVGDILREYSGKLEINKIDQGGLRVVIRLPAAQDSSSG